MNLMWTGLGWGLALGLAVALTVALLALAALWKRTQAPPRLPPTDERDGVTELTPFGARRAG